MIFCLHKIVHFFRHSLLLIMHLNVTEKVKVCSHRRQDFYFFIFTHKVNDAKEKKMCLKLLIFNFIEKLSQGSSRDTNMRGGILFDK